MAYYDSSSPFDSLGSVDGPSSTPRVVRSEREIWCKASAVVGSHGPTLAAHLAGLLEGLVDDEAEADEWRRIAVAIHAITTAAVQ